MQLGGRSPANLWYWYLSPFEQPPRYAALPQVIHARWALLGALGILVPELLADYAGFKVGSLGPVWFKDSARAPI